MPLRETEAIVLRTYRLGEADKIASLFTRQLGRLRAVAQGALRPKSRYGGTLEPLSYVRIWIFERENRDLLRLNSVEIIESFFDMQKDYRVQLAAQYLSEVRERLLPEREVNERIFRLLVAVLRALKTLRRSTAHCSISTIGWCGWGVFCRILRPARRAGALWGKRAAITPAVRNRFCAVIASTGKSASVRRHPGHGSSRLQGPPRQVVGGGKGAGRLPRGAPLLRGDHRKPHGKEADHAADDGRRGLKDIICPWSFVIRHWSLVVVLRHSATVTWRTKGIASLPESRCAPLEVTKDK